MIGACFTGNSGTHRWIGASRSSFPRSASCSTATAVSVFVNDAIRNCDSGVAGTQFSTSAIP